MNINSTKATLVSVLITGSLFTALTFLFVSLGILSFGSPILAGVVPFLTPAVGLGLYHFLNERFPNNELEKFSLLASNLLLGVCVALLFFGYMKWFTAITFFMLFALLFYIEYKNKLRFMYRFYRCYLLLLAPFYLACLGLISQGSFKFNEAASLKLKLGAVAIEGYFYFMLILLLAVYLFELFKRKTEKVNG